MIQNYQFTNEILCFKDNFKNRLVIELPKVLQKDIIWHYHFELGHMGSSKIEWLISKFFHWKNMSREIRQTLKTCDSCQKAKKEISHLLVH